MLSFLDYETLRKVYPRWPASLQLYHPDADWYLRRVNGHNITDPPIPGLVRLVTSYGQMAAINHRGCVLLWIRKVRWYIAPYPHRAVDISFWNGVLWIRYDDGYERQVPNRVPT